MPPPTWIAGASYLPLCRRLCRGYEVKASQKELADVSVEVADHHLDVQGLARWFAERAVPSKAS